MWGNSYANVDVNYEKHKKRDEKMMTVDKNMKIENYQFAYKSFLSDAKS